MLRTGTATIAEVAWLAKASHQRVSYWAKRAGINARKCRKLYLTKEWHANWRPDDTRADAERAAHGAARASAVATVG
jgi:hypothetical protein